MVDGTASLGQQQIAMRLICPDARGRQRKGPEFFLVSDQSQVAVVSAADGSNLL